MDPFQAFDQTADTIAVTVASAAVELNRGGLAGDCVCRVYNVGDAIAFIKFGPTGVTAAITNIPIPPGGVELFRIGASTHVAAITSAATATVYFTCGRGI